MPPPDPFAPPKSNLDVKETLDVRNVYATRRDYLAAETNVRAIGSLCWFFAAIFFLLCAAFISDEFGEKNEPTVVFCGIYGFFNALVGWRLRRLCAGWLYLNYALLGLVIFMDSALALLMGGGLEVFWMGPVWLGLAGIVFWYNWPKKHIRKILFSPSYQIVLKETRNLSRPPPAWLCNIVAAYLLTGLAALALSSD